MCRSRNRGKSQGCRDPAGSRRGIPGSQGEQDGRDQQDGRTIEHPTYTVNSNEHNTITDDFCDDWVAVTQDGTIFFRFKGMCDKNGCDIQPHRLGTHNFFDSGSDFQVDSTKPVTATTQFITADGTDHGKLTEVRQFYQKDGRTIEHQTYTANGNEHNTITDDFCGEWVAVTQDGTVFFSGQAIGGY